jgi:hypothetical protein
VQEVLFVQESTEMQEIMETVDTVDGMDATTLYRFSTQTGGK